MEGTPYCLLSQRRDLFLFCEAKLHDVVAEPAPVGLLVLEGFLELCRGNALLLEEQLAYSNSHATQLQLKRGPTRETDNNNTTMTYFVNTILEKILAALEISYKKLKMFNYFYFSPAHTKRWLYDRN